MARSTYERHQTWVAEWHLRRTMHEFSSTITANGIIRGLDQGLIDGAPGMKDVGRIRRRPRLGALLNYYCRTA